MTIKNILVGADPELFMKKDGKYVSAWNMIPGDKSTPHKVNKGAVQVDGMALEFNIDPAGDEDTFITNLDTVVQILREMVPEYEVVADPVAQFTKEYLEAQDPKALELGCDPDYNGWTRKENVKPDAKVTFRTGAGHVHVGVVENAIITDERYFNVCADAVKEMDLFLGLPSLFYDNDTKRRELYGKAGAFRPKKYGFEYRTLSNKWLSHENLKRWVFRATQACMTSFLGGGRLADKYNAQVDIQEVINTSNKTEAMKIIRDAGIPLPAGI